MQKSLRIRSSKLRTKIKIIVIMLPMLIIPLRSVYAENITLIEPLPGQTEAITEVGGLADYLVKIYNLGLVIAGVLAMAGIMIGGFMYITSGYAGNLVKMADGKSIIQSSLLGLGVALLSYLLIYTIDPRLTHPKDVFMDISGGGTCQGGIPNVADEETCKGYCTVSSSKPEDQLYTMSYDANKCCKCIEKNQSSGFEVFCDRPVDMQVSLSKCESICVANCQSGKTCKRSSQAIEGCCRCETILEVEAEQIRVPDSVQDENTQVPPTPEVCKNSCMEYCRSSNCEMDENRTGINHQTGICGCECTNCIQP